MSDEDETSHRLAQAAGPGVACLRLSPVRPHPGGGFESVRRPRRWRRSGSEISCVKLSLPTGPGLPPRRGRGTRGRSGWHGRRDIINNKLSP